MSLIIDKTNANYTRNISRIRPVQQTATTYVNNKVRTKTWALLSVAVSALCLSTTTASAQTKPYIQNCSVENIYFPTQIIHPLGAQLKAENQANPADIIGGVFANINAAPGLVSLISYSDLVVEGGVTTRSVSGACGATRIHENYLVTAAHCVEGEKIAMELVYGASNTRDPRRGRAYVNKAYCHKGYAKLGYLHNDIALIDISDPALSDLRSNVVIADIGNLHEALKPLLHKPNLEITGWGMSHHNENLNDPITSLLKKGEVNLLWYGPSNIHVGPRQENATSICSGDSGGPLYWIGRNNTKQIVGIVSSQSTPMHQQQCQQANRAFFTNISGYANWISEVIAMGALSDTDIRVLAKEKTRTILAAGKFSDNLAWASNAKYTGKGGYKKFKRDAYKDPATYVEGNKNSIKNAGYIVNGDVFLPDEKALLKFYNTYVYNSPGRLAVYNLDGKDQIWNKTQQQKITYCISKMFGDVNYSRVKQAMVSATRAWEVAGNVDFIHLVAQDKNCTSANKKVVFDVHPISVNVRYLARAFYPGYKRKHRNLIVSHKAFYYPDHSAGMSLTGILRHELGHTIGARHEHNRPEAGACYEDSDWRPVTNYDGYSVMHYPQCNGLGGRALQLTHMDKNGIACLYGPAAGFNIDTNICTYKP